MLKKWIVLLLSAIGAMFVLTACHSPVYNQTQANVANIREKAIAARHKSDNDAKPQGSVVVKKGLYVDTTPINLDNQPSWLNNHIVINGDQLPFTYYSRTIGSGAGGNVLTKYQTALDSTAPVSISYNGTIRGALDLLASKSGYVYTVHNKSIYWQAFVTRTFDIAFMPGATDYLMGKTAGGSGGGGGGGSVVGVSASDPSDAEYSTLKGTLSVWDDLNSTITQLLSADGKVFVSQATTTVTVRDRPTNVDLVAQYIRNLNNNLSKQVLVKVEILEVNLENSYDFGINWRLVVNAFHNSPFILNGNYGTPVSITALTAQSAMAGTSGAVPNFGFNPAVDPSGGNEIPSYSILLNALNQQGKTSIVSQPRVVCLNNQVSVIRITSSEGYVASVQNTTLAAGGTAPTSTITSQVTPGNLITGLTLFILPKIMNNSIFLQVNADLSTNDGFKTFPGSNQVQLPNITMKHFNQRSVIKSGDTLILAGFRQIANRAGANQFITSQALGGMASQQVNRETIVLITPILLHGSA